MVLLLEEKNLPDHRKLRRWGSNCSKCKMLKKKKKKLELAVAYISEILFSFLINTLQLF